MQAKAFLFVFIVLAQCFAISPNVSAEDPYKIYVYTKPGGLIDTTARKVAANLEKVLDANVVVYNYPGGKGVKALKLFLEQQADGKSILAVTNSFISQVQSFGFGSDVDQLKALGILAQDYEAFVVNADSQFKTLEDIVRFSKKEQLVWSGPAAGGTDYNFAIKFWQLAGISGKWLPYSSGKQAMLAVLGGFSDVYVGNYADAEGFAGLKVIATTNTNPDFLPNTPSFADYGYTELNNLVLWRGFMINQATPEQEVVKLQDALLKAHNNPGWQEYLQSNYINSEYVAGELANKKTAEARNETSVIKTDKSILDYYHYLVAILLIITSFFLIRKQSFSVEYEIKTIIISMIYVAALFFFNFYILTTLFIPTLGGFKKLQYSQILLLTILALSFSYLVFELMLGVPLS